MPREAMKAPQMLFFLEFTGLEDGHPGPGLHACEIKRERRTIATSTTVLR